MAVITDLYQFFTPESIGQILKDSTPARLPIWERVFKTRQHPFPYINRKTMHEQLGNVPLIKRGSASIGISEGSETYDLFEPQPISINTILKAKDFLDLKHIHSIDSLRTWIAEKIVSQKEVIDTTTEALCEQAISGLINYAIKVYEGDLGDFQVDFGPLVATPSTFVGGWSTADIDGIFRDISALVNAIRLYTKYGKSGRIGILAGENAFFTLIGKVNSNLTSSTVNMKIEQDTVILNGWRIENFGSAQYVNLKTGATVKAIPDDSIYIFAEDAPFNMNFLAIDDFDANGDAALMASPFYTKLIKQEDPSGIKIWTQSKPMPTPVTLASSMTDVIA